MRIVRLYHTVSHSLFRYTDRIVQYKYSIYWYCTLLRQLHLTFRISAMPKCVEGTKLGSQILCCDPNLKMWGQTKEILSKLNNLGFSGGSLWHNDFDRTLIRVGATRHALYSHRHSAPNSIRQIQIPIGIFVLKLAVPGMITGTDRSPTVGLCATVVGPPS
jgi:hypothetical protein